MMSKTILEKNAAMHWDNLHKNDRFLPVYPNDNVVRFIMRNFKQKDKGLLRALDVGSGGGRHLKLLCELGFQTFGVDISEVGIQHCDKLLKSLQYQADLRISSMSPLPYSDEYFDAVISFGVYYYTSHIGMCQAVTELYRVLKQKASAFVVLRTTDDYRYGKGKMLEKNTFQLEIEDTNECGAVMHFLAEDDVFDVFSCFSDVAFEKEEMSFNQRKGCNSDWLITVKK